MTLLEEGDWGIRIRDKGRRRGVREQKGVGDVGEFAILLVRIDAVRKKAGKSGIERDEWGAGSERGGREKAIIFGGDFSGAERAFHRRLGNERRERRAGEKSGRKLEKTGLRS